MGIPKFFRWLSERYPLCSQLVAEHNVPEFDNFYLDMNGIIHNCARAITSGDQPFTETEIFVAVFAYVQSLFETIKPRGTMFLAVDGVAPRAKCNQQRARRFRTAKEMAKEQQTKLKRSSRGLNSHNANDFDAITARFDSNCITPGTTFMHHLSEHMKYLIARRVEENAAWRDVQIIFSGADVPGEGEHKIMEYIRLCKAQPGYNPNMRHCLYGLDADLILLGLLSHEPHFALLREEVQFGKMRVVKSAEEQRFYLLHLCLMREYMALEFSNGNLGFALPKTLATESNLNQEKVGQRVNVSTSIDSAPLGPSSNSPSADIPIIELECFIDDFILLMCFVGNDFLPNLPDFHLGEGVLEYMFEAYKQALRRTGGLHINVNGRIQLEALLVVFEELMEFERQRLLAEGPRERSSSNRLHLQQLARLARNLLETFIDQSHILQWHSNEGMNQYSKNTNQLNSKERNWLNHWAHRFEWKFQTFDAPNAPSAIILIKPDSPPHNNDPSQFNDIRQEYIKALEELELDDHVREQQTWLQCKSQYYQTKFHFDSISNPNQLKSLVEDYCRGLQWNMDYYYRGVASWSWFYPHYYAPHISDIVDYLNNANTHGIGLKSINFADYSLDTPLKPLEQLMAVLPPASAALLPNCLACLMKDPRLAHFYPETFETDANGKKASWEHIVKIPFIDTNVLLPVLHEAEKRLDGVDRARNQFGVTITLQYRRSDDHRGIIPAPSGSNLPTLTGAYTVLLPYKLPIVKSQVEFVAALCEGARVGAYAMPGFPTLATLSIRGALEGGLGVQVFDQPAKSKSLALMVEDSSWFKDMNIMEIAERLVGKVIFVNWPHLKEAQVEYITDGCCRYYYPNPHQPLKVEECTAEAFDEFERATEIISKEYRRRCGVLIGQASILVFVRPFVGMTMATDGSTRKHFDSLTLIPYALQTVIPEVKSVDQRYVEQEAEPLSQAYPLNTPVISIGDQYYGTKGLVIGFKDEGKETELLLVQITPRPTPTPSFTSRMAKESLEADKWFSAQELCRELGLSAILLSKIASTMTLFWDGEMVRAADIGLGLKSDAKALMSIGLARRSVYGKWEFSSKTRNVLISLIQEFPQVFAALKEQLSGSGNTNAASLNIEGKTIFPTVKSRDELIAIVQPIKKMVSKILGPIVLVPFGEYLNPETIKAINSSWEDYLKRRRSLASIQELFTRAELLTATTAGRRLLKYQQQKFDLGQRVILVTESNFGQEGILIGMEWGTDGKSPERLRIMLDEMVIGGTNLSGTLEENGRGIIVERNECLNLNYIQPPLPRDQRRPPPPAIRTTSGTTSVMDKLKAAQRSKEANKPTQPTLQSVPVEMLFAQVSLNESSSVSSPSLSAVRYTTQSRQSTSKEDSTLQNSQASGRKITFLTPNLQWRSGEHRQL